MTRIAEGLEVRFVPGIATTAQRSDVIGERASRNAPSFSACPAERFNRAVTQAHLAPLRGTVELALRIGLRISFERIAVFSRLAVERRENSNGHR